MTFFFNDFWKYLSVFAIISLILRIVAFSSLEKYVNSLLTRSDEQLKRIMGGYARILKVAKYMLWQSPIYLVIIPMVVYLFIPKMNALIVFIAMVVLELLTLSEFLYTRRLLRYLGTHRSIHEQEELGI